MAGISHPGCTVYWPNGGPTPGPCQQDFSGCRPGTCIFYAPRVILLCSRDRTTVGRTPTAQALPISIGNATRPSCPPACCSGLLPPPFISGVATAASSCSLSHQTLPARDPAPVHGVSVQTSSARPGLLSLLCALVLEHHKKWKSLKTKPTCPVPPPHPLWGSPA